MKKNRLPSYESLFNDSLVISESNWYKESLKINNNQRINNNQIIKAGNGLYTKCSDCGKMVKINKFIFGGLHFCDK